jgi:hypothetical protein
VHVSLLITRDTISGRYPLVCTENTDCTRTAVRLSRPSVPAPQGSVMKNCSTISNIATKESPWNLCHPSGEGVGGDRMSDERIHSHRKASTLPDGKVTRLPVVRV